MLCSIKDLRQKTSEILALVEKGEEVIITFHGVKKARILPLQAIKAKKDGDGFGMWKDRDDLEGSESYVRNLRKGRHHGR